VGRRKRKETKKMKSELEGMVKLYLIFRASHLVSLGGPPAYTYPITPHIFLPNGTTQYKVSYSDMQIVI
jgi:hypothetical protein